MLDVAGILVFAFAGWMICDRRKRAHFAAIPELVRSLGRGTRSTAQFFWASIVWGVGALILVIAVGGVWQAVLNLT